MDLLVVAQRSLLLWRSHGYTEENVPKTVGSDRERGTP